MQSGSFAFLNIKGESKTKKLKQEKNPATMLKPQFSSSLFLTVFTPPHLLSRSLHILSLIPYCLFLFSIPVSQKHIVGQQLPSRSLYMNKH